MRAHPLTRITRATVVALFGPLFTIGAQGAPGGSFTLAQVKSYPFPNELTAAATGSRIAWALNEQGIRNVWVAEGPDFKARRLTNYTSDDGQEITSLSISPNGKYVVYVRGGDHGGNWDDAVPVNPTQNPAGFKVEVWSVPFDGGSPKAISEGDEPVISPRSERIVFTKNRDIMVSPIDGSSSPKKLFTVRGDIGDPQWSPDGSRLAFVAGRGDHSWIGIFSGDSTAITWIAPTTSRDQSPEWSPDGRQIAFVRSPGSGGAPDSILVPRPTPWSIWIADAVSGAAHSLYTSPATLRGSRPGTQGGTNLHFAANGRIVFLSEMDGWPHLYSISQSGGQPMLLTPGNSMAEFISLSGDGKSLVFAGNSGKDPGDIDRRHVVRVPVDQPQPQVMTPGAGLEWTPVVTGDGKYIAFIGATAQRPPLPAVMPVGGGTPIWIGEDRIPRDFPTAQLVVPKQVVFKSPDGVEVHSQLFERSGGPAKKPAVVFVHGGPPRQMLLGWHYSDYYSNTYALNQYLANQGFIVLSVNYRLGIGYGRDFQHPLSAGMQGATEYTDVKAAANYLRSLPQVDAKRIGIYGGSYGGFLTAMALARNSDLFAAGVDMHGVHDWTTERARGLMNRDRYEQPADLDRALSVAYKSSPVSYVSSWRSPVLLIHGDDDRNVRFNQIVDLVRRLEKAKVPYEEMIIPDDTHHFMRHSNAIRADSATADFLSRKLRLGATNLSTR
jgi:dipeptidyl aminopeptidase/acylaminoacyl peptidase